MDKLVHARTRTSRGEEGKKGRMERRGATRRNGTHRSKDAARGDGGEQCVGDLSGGAADADGDRSLRHCNSGA